MRILIVSPVSPFTLGQGAGIPSIREFLRGMDAREWKGLYLTPEDDHSFNSDFQSINYLYYKNYLSKKEIKAVNEFSVSRNFLSKIDTIIKILRTSFSLNKTFLNTLREFNPQVVYTMSERGLFYSWFISLILRRPLLLRSFGFIYNPSMKVIKFTKKGLVINYNMLLLRVFKASFYVFILDGNNSHQAIIKSKVLKSHIRIFRNGYDKTLRYSGGRRNFNSIERRHLSIGMCCRHDREKRIDRLITALPILLHRGYSIDVKLAGAGPLTSELRELSRTLGVDRFVTFCGLISRSELAGFYSSIDIYVQLNQNSNFGNSLIEALSCECIVVTCASDSETNWLLGGEDCCYFVDNPDQSTSLAEVFSNIIGDIKLLHGKVETGLGVLERKLVPWEKRIDDELDWLASTIDSN